MLFDVIRIGTVAVKKLQKLNASVIFACYKTYLFPNSNPILINTYRFGRFGYTVSNCLNNFRMREFSL